MGKPLFKWFSFLQIHFSGINCRNNLRNSLYTFKVYEKRENLIQIIVKTARRLFKDSLSKNQHSISPNSGTQTKWRRWKLVIVFKLPVSSFEIIIPACLVRTTPVNVFQLENKNKIIFFKLNINLYIAAQRRHWISWRVRIIAQIQDFLLFFLMSCVNCRRLPVPCHQHKVFHCETH